MMPFERRRRPLRNFERAMRRRAGAGLRRLFAAIPMSRQRRMTFKRVLFRATGPLFRNTRAYRNWISERGRAPLARPALLNAPVLPDRFGFFGRRRQPDGSLPNLDISVVTHNNARWLDGFFESLLDQEYPTEKIALFIADNASTDDTVAKIRRLTTEFASRFREIRVSERQNDGFGGGHNHNAGLGVAPFLLITNVDLKFHDTALAVATSAAARDADDVAAWEFRQKPYEHPKYYDPVSLSTAWCSAACLLLRRSAFKAVGGFDDRIFMYGEDVELSYRLRDRGHRLRYLPRAVVWHYTYEHEGEIKPIQLAGSILANGYLRMRYGNFFDILQLPIQLGRSIISRGPHPNHRRLLLRQTRTLLVNAPHFLLRRKRSALRFGFSGWDYELRRAGDFYAFPERKNSETALVSVVVRTYRGRASLLREAVTSVANQTYDNIELLVVEDGTDEAAEFVALIEQETGLRARHIRTPKRGRSHAGNVGLGAARGDYIMFLDDDDLLFADHVEVLVDAIQGNPEYLVAYSLAWQVETEFHSDGTRTEHAFNAPESHQQPYSRARLIEENFIPIQSILFDRRLYDLHGGFLEDLGAFEDWNLWIRYSLSTDFKFVEKTTSLYRVPASDKARFERIEHMRNFQDAARSAGLGRRPAVRLSKRSDLDYDDAEPDPAWLR